MLDAADWASLGDLAGLLAIAPSTTETTVPERA